LQVERAGQFGGPAKGFRKAGNGLGLKQGNCVSGNDIFISYSREERASARQFAESFAREGFSVWWDAVLRSGQFAEGLVVFGEEISTHAESFCVL